MNSIFRPANHQHNGKGLPEPLVAQPPRPKLGAEQTAQKRSHSQVTYFGRDALQARNRMKALGVTFEGEPQVKPWGTGVMFEDLYGNEMYMSQEPQA